jgi:hypothetical protein
MIRTLDERPSKLIRDKPIFSSERMLHEDYDCKGSAGEGTAVVSPKGLGSKMN